MLPGHGDGSLHTPAAGVDIGQVTYNSIDAQGPAAALRSRHPDADIFFHSDRVTDFLVATSNASCIVQG